MNTKTENKDGLSVSGDAICLRCKHKWTAVAPAGTTALACPECKLHQGVFDHLIFPESYWQCSCGNHAFALSKNSLLICMFCGNLQSW